MRSIFSNVCDSMYAIYQIQYTFVKMAALDDRAVARAGISEVQRAGNKIATFLAVLYIEVVHSCSITGRRDSMATYSIEPARDTLHGTFSREYPPILTINSGDTVLFRTLNSGWVLEPPSFKNANVKHFEPRIT